jgi:hypothetical protein
MKRQPRTPLEILQTVAEFFLASAEEIDQRVAAAFAAGEGSQVDVVAMMTIADERRLRAAQVAEKAAPFTSPRLNSIEVAPASQSTRERFQEASRRLSDQEAQRYLDLITSGVLSVEDVRDEIVG